EHPGRLRDELLPAVRVVGLAHGRQKLAGLGDPSGQSLRQRLALAHRTLEDAVQLLEVAGGVTVSVIAGIVVAGGRRCVLAARMAAVPVVGVAVVAVLVRVDDAVTAHRFRASGSWRRGNQLAGVIARVAGTAIVRSVVALLAGIHDAVAAAVAAV